MRNLVLLRGPAGCGKSTWIEKMGLKQYTLCADEIRVMVQSPILLPDGREQISQKNDKRVWELLYTLLEERMKRGEFCIVDATHARPERVAESYKKLCEKYRYRCYAVQFDTDLDTILDQNLNRNMYKQVPEDVIKTMYAQMERPLPNWVTTIKPEEFNKTFPAVLPMLDFSNYTSIHIFGDIHGCYDPLAEYFSMYPYREDNLYIFTGDYIDRGIQNKAVLEFLISLSEYKNVYFLEGNHEIWLRYYSEDREDEIRSTEFLRYTLPQIKELDKSKLREFCRRLGQLSWFTYHGNKYLVTHGGIPVLPSPYYSSEEYIKGVGKYEDYLLVEQTWNALTYDDHYQIHGHRNTENSPIKNCRVYNLCDTIEFGGYLRVAVLDQDGISEVKIKNNTYFVKEVTEEDVVIPTSEEPSVIIEQLRHNKFIYEKRLNGNVSSFNFTDRAFYEKEWNDQTQRARGLFVNTSTNEVVARAYDKFFNVNETSDTKLAELRRNLVFPVEVYVKYNGFMGIVGYDSETESVWYCSKSSNQSNFSNWFKETLLSFTTEEKLKKLVKDQGYSLVFEVIRKEDPHIIDYEGKDFVILLDAFKRSFTVEKALYRELWSISLELQVPVKEFYRSLLNYNEFYEFCEEVEKVGYRNDVGKTVEGYVMEDSRGYQVKIKSGYYKLWKLFRGIAVSMSKGRPVDTKIFITPESNAIYKFFRTLDRETLAKPIIELRKMFERIYEY